MDQDDENEVQPRLPAPAPPSLPLVIIPPKPWHLDRMLSTETHLRDAFRMAAKRSKKAEDLERYKEQREKVAEIETQLRDVYLRNNPDQVRQRTL
jgi:hypothetical protein